MQTNYTDKLDSWLSDYHTRMGKKAEKAKHLSHVFDFVRAVVSGEKPVNKEQKQMCERFVRDLHNDEYDIDFRDAEWAIHIIQSTFQHEKGQTLDGKPLRGKPFILQPWQYFIIYNLLGFYQKGTEIRRFKEAYIYLPRKNGKTAFVAALSWALALLERKSGSTVYIVGAALRQAEQSFSFLHYNLRAMGEAENFRIRDNNQEHSISGEVAGGTIHIEALAANPDKQDSLNSNIQILDEIHAYKTEKQYNVIRESGKAYTNKLTIGITTAGDDVNTFGYRLLKYCQSVVSGEVKHEQYFIFIAKADEDDEGGVNYTDPLEHEKANPNYGVTIRAEDMLEDALRAKNDEQQRKDFLAKSLNIYTAHRKAWFSLDTFRRSTDAYRTTTLSDVLERNLTWYGGVDLSRMYDLTAVALYAYDEEHDIDHIITHAWFPSDRAREKAEDDSIPIYQWLDDGQLSLASGGIIDVDVVTKWLIEMQEKGFYIEEIGFDRKFADDFFIGAQNAGLPIVEQKQYAKDKTRGFKRIERKAIEGKLNYFQNESFEYCVSNVSAYERSNKDIIYEKVEANARIDIFDASVMAATRMLENVEIDKPSIDEFFK